MEKSLSSPPDPVIKEQIAGLFKREMEDGKPSNLYSFCVDLKNLIEDKNVGETEEWGRWNLLLEKCNSVQEWLDSNQLPTNEDIEEKFAEISKKFDSISKEESVVEGNEVKGNNKNENMGNKSQVKEDAKDAMDVEDVGEEEDDEATTKVTDFLVEPYSKFRDNYYMVKHLVDKEKMVPDKYVDVEEMVPELDNIAENSREIYDKVERAFIEAKEKIRTNKDPGFQWPTMIKFSSDVDSASRELELYSQKLQKVKEKYKTSPGARLARLTKKSAKEVGKVGDLQKYKLPIKMVYEDGDEKIRRFELGEEDLTKPNKIIMMVGMTGAGKSLMINNIINYVYGVEFADNFRFQLIVDDEEIAERGKHASKSKANSMTSWVTGFNLHYQDGFKVDYSITIIDTPGFGDTRGVKYDEVIVDQIRHFFEDEDACPNQEITCIGFVIQASQARITEEQKYIFDQVLNIFGKDMIDNVFIMFTFADAQPPPALEAVKDHKIPFAENCTFKFNNSAVYAENDSLLSEFSWKFGYDSLKEYFLRLGGKDATSLKLTKEVLDERDYLKCVLGGLKEKIDEGMGILQAIESTIDQIFQLNGTLRQNQGFKIKKPVQQQRTKVINHHITNCKTCMFTCHDPCGISGDLKQRCASMRNGICGVCPGKCPWDMHSNGDRIYVYTAVEIEETIEDMCDKYNIALTDKDAKKTLLLNMLEEYKVYKECVFQDISQAAMAAARLEEIAIRNTFLTNVSYIERLIKSEEMSNRPNKKHRLEQLFDLLKKAKILDSAKTNPGKLTDHVSQYETTVMQKINDIEDVIEYDAPKYFETRVYAQGHSGHKRYAGASVGRKKKKRQKKEDENDANAGWRQWMPSIFS